MSNFAFLDRDAMNAYENLIEYSAERIDELPRSTIAWAMDIAEENVNNAMDDDEDAPDDQLMHGLAEYGFWAAVLQRIEDQVVVNVIEDGFEEEDIDAEVTRRLAEEEYD